MHAWKRSVMYTRCHFSNGLLGRNLVGWNIFLERIYYIHQVNLCSKISSLENQKGRPQIDNKNLSFSHIGRDKFFGKYPADLTQIPFRENLLHKQACTHIKYIYTESVAYLITYFLRNVVLYQAQLFTKFSLCIHMISNFKLLAHTSSLIKLGA